MALNENKYMIRFSKVGNGSKGGDAILIRLFDEKDNETLLLIDGGYQETGSAIIDFIKKNCTTTTIKVIFNTHPDRDHIYGLKTILENGEITIENLILNRPWRDAKFTKEMFDDDRITENSLIKRLKDAFCIAEEVEIIAKKKGVKVYSQFRDESGQLGILNVLGPSETLYKKGLLASDKTPESYIESGLTDYTPVNYTEEDYKEGDLQFINNVKGGNVPKEFIPSVQKGFQDCLSNGVLGGFPMTGLKVTLNDGSFHPVDSDQLSFELVAHQAFKVLCPKAGPVLMEPIMKVEVVTPEENMGDVIGDLNKRRGLVQGMDEARSGARIVKAMVPLAEMFGYVTALRTITSGRATSSMEYDHHAALSSSIAKAVLEEVKGHSELL